MAASNPGTSPAENTSDREIVGTRILNAPRDLVFSMFSTSAHLAKWWGPFGFRTTTYEFDFKPGGTWRFVMHGPDGTDYKNHIVFLEIARPDRIVYKVTPENESGFADFHVTITLAEEGQRTKLVWRMVFMSPEEREAIVKRHGAEEGLTQTISRLEREVAKATDATATASSAPAFRPKRSDLLITWTFDAPRDLVFSMWSDANHLRRWWGPKGCTIGFCNMDFRPGGQLLYNLRKVDGTEMWGKFVYREILPPERIVFVNSFSDPKGNTTRAAFNAKWPLEVLNTLTLSEQFGLTRLTLLGVPLNATEEEWDVFENMLMSLHQGFSGTFEQLNEYLAKSGGKYPGRK
ncbi:MAG: SRPBCC family protein [Candidatus Acidiferrum sp.]|jgi:uncharacterized protein YndB with AHSA1/START domain